MQQRAELAPGAFSVLPARALFDKSPFCAFPFHCAPNEKKQKQGQSADEGVREESYHRGKVPILKLALAALARVQEHNLVVFNVDMREKKMEDLTLLLLIK